MLHFTIPQLWLHTQTLDFITVFATTMSALHSTLSPSSSASSTWPPLLFIFCPRINSLPASCYAPHMFCINHALHICSFCSAPSSQPRTYLDAWTSRSILLHTESPAFKQQKHVSRSLVTIAMKKDVNGGRRMRLRSSETLAIVKDASSIGGEGRKEGERRAMKRMNLVR